MGILPYKADFYGWTQDQAAKLRVLLTARTDLDIDFENIAEEIESLGRQEQSVLHRRLIELDIHLMKLAFSLAWEPRRQWKATVIGQRHVIDRTLKDSPSLREWLRAEVNDAHEGALLAFDIDVLIRLPMNEVPTLGPFDFDDMLTRDWWPEARGID